MGLKVLLSHTLYVFRRAIQAQIKGKFPRIAPYVLFRTTIVEMEHIFCLSLSMSYQSPPCRPCCRFDANAKRPAQGRPERVGASLKGREDPVSEISESDGPK
jgi:hypothetical protein